MRRYSELITLPTLKERFEYLKLEGAVGRDTFGFDRWLNQVLYSSKEWKAVRNRILVRDSSCELAIPDRPIFGKVYIHHMNPITKEDILNRSDFIFNPDYLVCCSFDMHNAIHYGDDSKIMIQDYVPRTPNDTCPWRNYG